MADGRPPTTRLRRVGTLFKIAFYEWQKDKAVRLGASLSFYTVFSLPPLLMIAVLFAGMIYGRDAAEGRIVQEFQGLLGEGGATTIQTMILEAGKFEAGILPVGLGVAALLVGVTAVFVDLQDGLNTVWEVKPKPKSSLVYLLKIRALSLLAAMGTGFLVLISLMISALIAGFGDYLSSLWFGSPISSTLLQVGDFFVSFGMITILFAMLFKVLPDAKIAWKDVWLGAAFTALLFTIGKLLIGLYLGRSRIGSVYGAAGSLAILLLWIYYYSQIFFFGAEFTRAYADTYGSKIEPEEYAVHVTELERARQGMKPAKNRECEVVDPADAQ